ncbi:hypothetical protein BDV96DRAFT_605532 [Lophiotrema nucula]|uniref:Uncharacterized protein n=1 Tax=Lophiotrema nucula TaxID=690887 RepID=A0A6A5YNE4_9PLEO|nr:hypothetical protein BDV96DRAFT_605532 [Lophiotrema nucula]
MDDKFPDFVPLHDVDMVAYNKQMGLTALKDGLEDKQIRPKLGRINNATISKAAQIYAAIDLNEEIFILEAEANHILPKCFELMTQKHGDRHVAFWNSHRRDGREESPIWEACPQLFYNIRTQAAIGITPAQLSLSLTAYLKLVLLEYIPANSSLLHSLDRKAQKVCEPEPKSRYAARSRRYDRKSFAVWSIDVAHIAIERSKCIKAIWKVWEELVEMLVQMCCYTHQMRAGRGS